MSDVWLARGVRADTIPYAHEVLSVGREQRWPTEERRIGWWHCIIFPCYEDLADAMQQTLVAHGAVDPANPIVEEGSASRSDESGDAAMGGAGSSPHEGGPTAPETERHGVDELAPDADGVTWFTWSSGSG